MKFQGIRSREKKNNFEKKSWRIKNLNFKTINKSDVIARLCGYVFNLSRKSAVSGGRSGLHNTILYQK